MRARQTPLLEFSADQLFRNIARLPEEWVDDNASEAESERSDSENIP